MGKASIKLIANNKKAFHDYFIEEKYEAGIQTCALPIYRGKVSADGEMLCQGVFYQY